MSSVANDAIAAWMTAHGAALSQSGWRAEYNAASIHLYGRLKNGQPRRTATVYLLFDPERCPTRPWYIKSPGLPTARTFGHATMALREFGIHARMYAPLSANTPRSAP